MSLSQKVHRIETDSPVKKKFQVFCSIKIMMTVFWDMKWTITIGFLAIGASVNIDSYSQHFRQYFTLFIEWPSYINKHYRKIM